MQKNFAPVFGAVVAYILLMLYALPVLGMSARIVACGGCAQPFEQGTIYVITTIGGLVSALVVSKLAITKPGQSPAIVLDMASHQQRWDWVSNLLVLLYLGAWILTGVVALLVGVMLYGDANGTLSDLGTTWLGLAVASGYAYFGLDPTGAS